MKRDMIVFKQRLKDWKVEVDSNDTRIDAEVPTTMLNAMVEAGIVRNPRERDNYLKLPGVPEKDILDRFALREMPDGSPFSTPKRWETTFYPPDSFREGSRRKCVLELNGINYRGNVYLNGHKVADASAIAGTYRKFDIELSKWIVDDENILTLEIFPPGPKDLAFSFVDWHPMPPDKCSGLWKDVYLIWSGGVRIRDFHVHSRLLADYSEADVRVVMEVENSCDEPVDVHYEVQSSLFTISGSTPVQPGSTAVIECTSNSHPVLLVNSPPIWWPYQLGDQNLVNITASVSVMGIKQDARTVEYGFREITSYINANGDRQFVVNGHDFLIRGAAWAPDMLMKESKLQDKTTVAYVKNMGLNSLRFEGNFGSDTLWQLCDREGILLLAGWVCDSPWEEYKLWDDDTYSIAEESLRSLLRRFRNHASFAAWLYGSDLLAPADVEKMYLSVLREEVPELCTVASAGKYVSEVTGNTGVKMSGPYSYVPPVYWYLDEMPGVAKGFNTETCPDVCVPPYESLVRMFPPNQIAAGSKMWRMHSGMRQFNGTEIVETAVRERYGASGTMEQFARKAQVLSYETWRAMFEACARNRGMCTGIIGWKLNSSWPSVIWQLYDYYNYPTGGFFGTKKACSKIHVLLDYKDNSLWAVNNTLDDRSECTVYVELNALEKLGGLKKMWVESYVVDIGRNDTFELGYLPKLSINHSVYFLFISLDSGDGIQERNCYWLSGRQDVMSNKHEQFGTTEVLRHADFSELNNLPEIALDATGCKTAENRYKFTIRNSSKVLAFFVEVKLRAEKGEQLLPVLWTDNFLTIKPHETVAVSGELLCAPGKETQVVGEVAGWNSKRSTIYFPSC